MSNGNAKVFFKAIAQLRALEEDTIEIEDSGFEHSFIQNPNTLRDDQKLHPAIP